MAYSDHPYIPDFVKQFKPDPSASIPYNAGRGVRAVLGLLNTPGAAGAAVHDRLTSGSGSFSEGFSGDPAGSSATAAPTAALSQPQPAASDGPHTAIPDYFAALDAAAPSTGAAATSPTTSADAPLPPGVRAFNPGKYQLTGIPGLPGGPTRRSEVFTGKGAFGEPVYTNNPYDPLLRGAKSTSPSNEAIYGVRTSPDEFASQAADYTKANNEDLNAQNANLLSRQIALQQLPQNSTEYGQRIKDLSEAKAAADNAVSKRLESEATARSTNLASDKNTLAANAYNEAIKNGKTPDEANVLAAQRTAEAGLPDTTSPQAQSGYAAAQRAAAAESSGLYSDLFGGRITDPNVIDLSKTTIEPKSVFNPRRLTGAVNVHLRGSGGEDLGVHNASQNFLDQYQAFLQSQAKRAARR